MQLKFFVILAACSLTWGMQNFVSFEHDVIQSFLNGLRTRFAVQGNYIPILENTVPGGVVTQSQVCNCPDDNPLTAVQNGANNNNNNNGKDNVYATRSISSVPAQKPLAPDQGPFVNRVNKAPAVYPPILVQNVNNKNDNNNNNNNNSNNNNNNPNNNSYNKNKNNQNNYNGKLKESLATNLLHALAPQNPYKNLVYSPLSLELLLTFVTLGAKGQTANELSQVLKLPANKQQIISQASAKIPKERNTRGARINMANKMYYAYDLVPENNISNAANMLHTDFEATNFSPPELAAANINKWVAWKTQNRIQNLIDPQQLEPTTESILINAIHFKAQWEKEFSTSDTEPRDFQNLDGQTMKVDMMYNEDQFRYGEFPSLGAKVLELPYNDTDISMMIILPDDIYGINNVEKAMENVDLAGISQQLHQRTVNLRMPKFKFDCELDLVPALMQLGIQELFSNNADLSGFFRYKHPKVSQVRSKAFLEVNEAGSEAAAASFYKLVPLSLPAKLVVFTVDHPFIFAIRTANSVYFLGHVVTM